jgi:hypothetical protein
MTKRTDIIFERVVDGRKIRLTKKQWFHISSRHPGLTNKIYLIDQTLLNPTRKLQFSNETIKYYRYFKEMKYYLMVAVRTLNGEGFVITAYFTRK